MLFQMVTCLFLSFYLLFPGLYSVGWHLLSRFVLFKVIIMPPLDQMS